jgi:hypothetical protein
MSNTIQFVKNYFDKLINPGPPKPHILRAFVNHTRNKQFYQINKKNSVFVELEAAFAAFPEWCKTDDIRINAICFDCGDTIS